jgi:two-component system response regulator GlrR
MPVRIPVSDKALSKKDEWTALVEKAAGHSILVVDDEENFLALLRWFLTNRGYEVQTALDGEEAVRLIQAKAFDLALVDVRMGPVDGLTVLAELRQRLPSTKVVMMTAFPTVVTIKKSFERGACAFLTKPVDLHELLKTIQGLS